MGRQASSSVAMGLAALWLGGCIKIYSDPEPSPAPAPAPSTQDQAPTTAPAHANDVPSANKVQLQPSAPSAVSAKPDASAPEPDADTPKPTASAEPAAHAEPPSATVQRVVNSRSASFSYCYQKGLLTNPTLEGRVITRFVIDGGGAVRDVRDGGSSLPDTSVIACVQRTFQQMVFPKPAQGEQTITYPLVFKPKPARDGK